MYLLQPEMHSRRAFLKRTGQLAVTGTALPFAMNLAAISEAAAFDANDYKALVCVFLYGGNDHDNTVIPYDNTHYDRYSTIRGGNVSDRTGNGIAIGQAELTNTLLSPSMALAGAREYALHPAMTTLRRVFNANRRAAVQLNVGPLMVPLIRSTYNSSNRTLYPRPPNLFSHNDQQSVWQSSSTEGATVGWGGDIGDLAIQSAANTNSLFTCISVTGNAVFLSGDTALQYQVSTGGAVRIRAATDTNLYGVSVRDAIQSMVQQPRQHVLENEYNTVTRRSKGAEEAITTALATQADNVAPFNGFPNTGISNQLKMVARLIGARTNLGNRRQVFLVSMGGFDLHDNLISQQPRLMGQLSDALTAFYDTTVAMGIADKVTAFTGSDFGRTLQSNGDGSDHGWGAHHFVVGGAVNGGRFYGHPPPISTSNTGSADDQWHVGQGRLIPTTSVDQYAATMAKWFGVADNELNAIFPSLSNFGGTFNGLSYPRDLGFMA